MNVLIMGGTSGIGLGLAQHYWVQGARVAICGRHPGKVADLAWVRDPRISVHACDVADRAAVERMVHEFAAGGLDLLIVTAGQYADAAAIAQDRERALPVLHVNVGGLDNAFSAASAAMLPRGRGQLVAVASIAGLQRDYPTGSLYSASKRAAIAIADAYRKALAPFGIAVTVIVPGYVDTARLRELNQGDAGRKPFLMTEQDAVTRIAAAIACQHERCVFPWQLHALVRVFNCLPLFLKRLRKK
ncbi:SDR family NAD(P)-dependent oxidoreductase [Duganella aceris]|uniref:SDR family NAD(P)-dependent oxidoreductase n=1 Tax=Duganella aceris TaxID=2703883 RepID=A0ABX0FJ44_9BURK|nr:SDR family NAD(P)-dependent oxidoreductase [Duganella aceris]NGZ84567.1 SDR family NAD(P)-dependent oxidoreductase [Duganella aceris]